MSAGNIQFELETGANQTTGGVMFGSGATVPADGTAGYGKGCIFVDTDGTTLDNTLYLNIGTAASCNFDAMVNS